MIHFLIPFKEIKLLQKILLLASQLESKRGKQIDNWQRRRFLLLTALALISRGCGMGTKLLQLDNLVDLISSVLCKVSFSVALNCLNDSNGLYSLIKDIKLAEQLRLLHSFKQRLNKRPRPDLKCSLSALQPYLLLLDQKRAFLTTQHQRALLNRRAEVEAAQQHAQKQSEAAHAVQRARNAQLAAHLASLQDGSKAAFLAPFLHAWRCLLNFRLVRARTRRRFKAAILTRWRRKCRFERIATIFYGKKVKLRTLNRWYSRRFGRNREQELMT